MAASPLIFMDDISMIFDGSKVDQNAPENPFDNQREGYDVVCMMLYVL